MTAPNVTTTDPTGDPSDTWNTRQWINYIHSASAVPKDSPMYLQAHQSALDAAARLGTVQDKLNADDPERLRPGAMSTFLVALGNGASLGLLNNLDDTKFYLQAGRDAGHSTAATVGNLVGMGATTAITGAGLSAAAPTLSATAAGAISGAGLGAISGAANADQGDRLTGSLIGAGIGALGGAAGGYATGKILPVLARLPGAAGRFFNPDDSEVMEQLFPKKGIAKEEVGLRRDLIARGASPSEIRDQVRQFRADRFRKLWKPVEAPEGAPPSSTARQARLETEAGGRPPANASVADRIRSAQDQLHRDLTPQEKAGLINSSAPTEMDTPSFQRTAQRLGTKVPPVPEGSPSGVGNAPPNPALAEQYVREANERIAAAAKPDALPEVMQRVQRGATKAQLAYRAKLLGLPPPE